jgi:transposase InsO family protein
LPKSSKSTSSDTCARHRSPSPKLRWLSGRAAKAAWTTRSSGLAVTSASWPDRTYGAQRVWHDVLAVGLRCGLHRIERLMRAQALRTRPRRRGLPQDKGERSAVADNVLDRQF